MSGPKKKNPKAITIAFSEKQKLFANLEPFSFFFKIFIFLEAHIKLEVFLSPHFFVRELCYVLLNLHLLWK